MRGLILLVFIVQSYVSFSQSDFSELKSEFLAFRQAGDQDSSLSTAKRMHRLALQEQGDTSYWYALSARYIGNPFYSQENVDSCLFYWEKSAKLFSEYHPDHADYAMSLQKLGLFYYNLEDYQKAKEPLQIALDIFNKVGEEHKSYVNCLYNLGAVYYHLGNYHKVEEFFLQALEIEQKILLGEDQKEYANNLFNMGILYEEFGDDKKAEEYYLRALEIQKKILKAGCPDYVSHLNDLGVFYSNRREYQKAEQYYLQALEMQKEMLLDDHPDFLLTLTNLGNNYELLGDYQKAKEYYLKDLEISKKVLREDNPNLEATLLNALSRLSYDLGEYKNAAEYSQRLLAHQKNKGENNESYASTLNFLGIIYFTLSNYAKAEEYLLKALDIRKQILGEEHLDYGATLTNLGLLYKDLGDYQKAEKYYQQDLEIQKKADAEDGHAYANTLNNLGILYSDLGNYQKAEDLYLKALAIRKKNQGVSQLDYASSLDHLGNLYYRVRNYQKAEEYYLQAQGMRKKIPGGEEHIDYTLSLINLGNIYSNKLYFRKAEECYLLALTMEKNALGEDHPQYASTLGNLGALYSDIGNYQKAEEYYQQALAIEKKVLGEEHPDFNHSQYGLAKLRFLQQDYHASAQLLSTVFRFKSNEIVNNFEWLTDSQIEAYWENESDFFPRLGKYASVISPYQGAFTTIDYDAALFSKSRLLETKRIARSYRDTDPLFNELKANKFALKHMTEDSEFDVALFQRLKNNTDSLDLLIQNKYPEYQELKRNLNIRWQDVQQGLLQGQIAVEFTQYYDQVDSSYKFAALLVKPNLEFPQFIPLCSEEQLTSFLQENHPGEIANARILYQWLWHPLVAHLDNSQEVFYSTSGILNEIPFHTLVSSERNQPLEFVMDHFNVHRLTSTRYLYRGFHKSSFESQHPTVSLVGGVDFYNLPSTTLAQNSTRKKRFGFRGNNDLGESLENIPATLDEVQKIQGFMEEAQWSTDILSGDQATEENLMAILHQSTPDVLHVATHGFSFEPPHDEPLDLTLQERFNYRYSADPMERSGIILAGGNWKWIGNDTLHIMQKRDGILNAKETSTLNLKGCQLVVLSACQTALGDVDDTEGTFGIVRGFKLAGVDQLMVSLWKVPDDQTSEFMQEFYKVLVQNKNIPSSFRFAQNSMRAKYPTNPRLWAAFVLVR